MESKEKILSHKLFLQQEDANFHLPFDTEMAFYETVKNGDVERLKTFMNPMGTKGMGKLSNNPVRNIQYHMVITVAMITRFCVEGGMPAETAYTLSDIYIQQIDTTTDMESLNQLHHDLVFDYTERMRNIKNRIGVSKPIITAADYIYNHLNEKLSLDELADVLHMNKSYVCELFKKETGMTVLTYITKLKVEAAQKMLIYSEYSSVDIANYFNFSSHSHFISTFKKYAGMTPKEYQKLHFRKHFEERSNA